MTANEPKQQVAFEIVSVRESAPGEHFSQRLVNEPHSSDFLASNLWISQLIGQAFGVDYHFQVEGVPDWIKSRRFDVLAKNDDCRDAFAKLDLARATSYKQSMLQSMLRDRFHLQQRIENRMLPSQTLVQASNGIKFPRTQSVQADGQQPDVRTEGSSQGVEIRAKRVTMATLTQLLKFYLKTSVADGTGLHDVYDLDLRFGRTQGVDDDPNPDAWPPIQVAIEQQLGLKLVPLKKSTPVVVVERIDLPTPN